MRQLTHAGPGRVEWTAVLEPSLGSPTALGREAIAEVVDMGEGVTRFVPGDRAIVPFQVSCGICGHCRAGLTSSCQSVPLRSCFGLGDAAGGYGRLVSELVRRINGPPLLKETVRATAQAGLLTISTMYPADPTLLPILTMFERCLTITTGQPHARALVSPVLAALENGLDLGAVTDEVLAWDDARLAFTRQWGKRLVADDEFKPSNGSRQERE